MKNLIICSFLLLFWGFGVQAQEIVNLEKTTISSSPIEMLPTSNDGEYKCVLNADYTDAFTEDPIGFLDRNLDIHGFIALVKDKNYDSYLVTISSAKGYLQASYDKEGNLMDTQMKFKNIIVPAVIRNELYRNHKGWRMVQNSYRASGKNTSLDKEMYRIKLTKGKERKIIKIVPGLIPTSLALND